MSKTCQGASCSKSFGMFNKKYTCRVCNNNYCGMCCVKDVAFPERGIIPGHRVCNSCLLELQKSQSTANSAPTFNMNSVNGVPGGSADGEKSSIDQQLEEMMEEQQLAAPVRDRMRAMDKSQKWQILLAYKQMNTSDKVKEGRDPLAIIDKLGSQGKGPFWKQADKLRMLAMTIKSESKTWSTQFVRGDGLLCLLEGLQVTRDLAVREAALQCVTNFIHTDIGLENFLDYPASVMSLASFLINDPGTIQSLVSLIFAFSCSADIERGYPLIYESLSVDTLGKPKFKCIVDILKKSDDLQVCCDIMVLINALVNTPDFVSDRQHARFQFYTAGLEDVVLRLRGEVVGRITVDSPAPKDSEAPPLPRMNSASLASPARPARQTSSLTHSTSAASILRSPAVNGVNGVASNSDVNTATITSSVTQLLVQLDLFDSSAEQDRLEIAREDMDISDIEAVINYVKVNLIPSAGEHFIPLLQMFCNIPTHVATSSSVWTTIYSVIKYVLTTVSDGTILTYDELYQISDSIASGKGFTPTTPTPSAYDNPEVKAIKLELASLKQQLEDSHNIISTLKASGAGSAPVDDIPPPPRSPVDTSAKDAEIEALKLKITSLETNVAAVPTPVPTGPSPAQIEALQARIAQLERDLAAAKVAPAPVVGGPAVAAVPAGPPGAPFTDIPPAPVVPGFELPPHLANLGPPVAAAPAPVAAPVAAPAPAGPAGAPFTNIPPAPVVPGYELPPHLANLAPPVAAAVPAPMGGPPAPMGGPMMGGPPPPMIPGFDCPPAPMIPGMGGPPAPMIAGMGVPPPPDLFGGAPPPPDLFGGAPPAPMLGGAPPAPMLGGVPAAPMLGGGPAVPVIMEAPKPKLPYNKKEIKPSVKMRPLHWTRIDDKLIEGSMWASLNDEKVKIDVKEIEAMFSQVMPKRPAIGGGGDGDKKDEKKNVPTQVSFVDGQRAQNINIALSRFRPLTFDQMRDAIMAMDTAVLSAEKTSNLLKWLPMPEEIEAVASYDGPVADLANPDKYILAMSKVPRLERRLEALYFKHQFESLQDEIAEKMKTCLQVLNGIKNSTALKKTLEYILALGNYLNGGTKKGGAYGFQINFLTRLGDTKTQDNKSTLLQYLVTLIDKNDATKNLLDDFQGVAEAARIEIPALQTEVNKMNGSMRKTETELANCEKNPAPNCKFSSVMSPFVSSSKPKVEKIVKDLEKIIALSSDLAKAFGEDPKKLEADAIFNLFNEFSQQINRTRDALARLKAQQEREAKAALNIKKPAAGGAPGAAPGGEAPVEERRPLRPGMPRPGPGGPAPDGGEHMNQLQMMLQARRGESSKPLFAPKEESASMDAKVNATLTGTDSDAIMKEINARRAARAAAADSGPSKRMFGGGGQLNKD